MQDDARDHNLGSRKSITTWQPAYSPDMWTMQLIPFPQSHNTIQRGDLKTQKILRQLQKMQLKRVFISGNTTRKIVTSEEAKF